MIPPTTRLWMQAHARQMTRLDWALVGEKVVVIVCAGIALAFGCGWLR